MRLQDYINVLRKRWWLIGLVALSAAVAAYVFSKLQTPLYRARAEYSVGVNRLDSGATIFAEQTYNHYRNQVYNPDQMQILSNELGIDWPGSSLMEYVRLQPQPLQSRFVIEVDFFDQDTARRLAAAVGERLNAVVVEENRNLRGEDRLSLKNVLSARDMGKAKPDTRINVLAGGILGLILGVLLAFVLEYMDDTLKNAADIERYTNLVTVGSIPSGAAQGGARSRLRPATSVGIVSQPYQHQESQRHD